MRYVVALAAALLALTRVPQAPPPAAPYIFSYFTNNGEDGLHLLASADGVRWTALNGGRSFLYPAVGSRLMRDPSITRGPDGMFHLVWTTGWSDNGIGIAHSKDLIEWSAQQFLPVMADARRAELLGAGDLLRRRQRPLPDLLGDDSGARAVERAPHLLRRDA
jgi:hypothetical protein